MSLELIGMSVISARENEDKETMHREHPATHKINLIRKNSFKTEVEFDGRSLNMEIDTGSGVTLLSKQDFEKINGDLNSLDKSRLILRGYSVYSVYQNT